MNAGNLELDQVRFIIITGQSGAGKSTVMQSFEDLGYFCVDNLPPTFIPTFAELIFQAEGKIDKIALVSDIRGGQFFSSLLSSLTRLVEMGIDYEILFLEADTLELIKRFKETRRKHPLWEEHNSIQEAIEREEKELESVRTKSHMILNTSNMAPRELKEKIRRHYTPWNDMSQNLLVHIISFGYKYGIPLDADIVLDVRFLPNPYYQEDLKQLTGNDRKIERFMESHTVTGEFMAKLKDILTYTLPLYLKEGKSQLVIAVGCTGGKHRSVVIVNWLQQSFLPLGYLLTIQHRDLDKN